MKWNKYTLLTTTEAEDLISSMMMDVGIEGIEIEDKIPLSEKDRSQMFVDILPEGPADDGPARISFYLEPEQASCPADVLDHLKIPHEEVAICLINGFHSKLSDPVKDQDVLALFPPVGGG